MKTSRKRPWSVAELTSNGPLPPHPLDTNQSPTHNVGANGIAAMYHSPDGSSKHSNTPPGGGSAGVQSSHELSMAGVTSRKSTACPACRKQKTKCIMDNEVPPCKRCVERGLLCSPNKTVQDIMKDQVRWNSHMVQQVTRLQTALNEARAALSLPPILSTEEFDVTDEQTASVPDPEPSEEGLNPVEGSMMAPDTLASAPIKSLYEVTKPSDAQAQEGSEVRFSGLVIEPDFISRGVITPAEGEQLTKSYITRLDHFFYGHVQKYENLTEIRKTSTLLAVTLVTIAALHDPLGSEVYENMSRELRNVASSLMFRHRLGLEDIKALCMGSYWLGDMTWILSALVGRKATALQYHTSHLNQPTTDREGFFKSQMWLLIYLANEQISLLRGAPPASVDRDFVNWEAHLASPYSGEIDLRLCSHIDLLILLSRVRQFYGVDTMKPIPQHMIPQLRDFLTQLDHWNHAWIGRLSRNKWLGNFPSEAVKLHGRFARFFICSLAFRGLSMHPSSPSPSISTAQPHPPQTTLLPDLHPIASTAINTALSILQQLIESDELRACLVGVPHYFHTMFAFAAVFLLKVATRYRAHVDIDPAVVFGTSRQVLEVFSHCPCARQHLVHRIAGGLKEMIERAEEALTIRTSNGNGVGRSLSVGVAMAKEVQAHQHGYHSQMQNGSNGQSGMAAAMYGNTNVNNTAGQAGQDMGVQSDIPQWFDLENFDFLSMSPPSWGVNFDF
ncbi:hypothetical protein FQN55_004669 [Onygenales sp. PD_40]|nr:hypothetical protein FQN55_004669 [Onygenales sp. PD_40]KAK2776718.1 hypothetical protein FQN53_002510 [Emmonsiellopsis sp. PD_33]KAK2785044.1 hypothetical protein FQN52_008766 [Onygenales sp. PD_12]KAK2797901.1 hypothetical protein FQN51_008209 [Onygenales sp. PD_10]